VATLQPLWPLPRVWLARQEGYLIARTGQYGVIESIDDSICASSQFIELGA
jgi:hypothetical protein